MYTHLPGELHTIFDSIAQMSVRMKEHRLSDEDLRQHFRLCRGVFGKWINERDKTIEAYKESRFALSTQQNMNKALQQQVDNLSVQTIVMQQEDIDLQKKLSDQKRAWDNARMILVLEKNTMESMHREKCGQLEAGLKSARDGYGQKYGALAKHIGVSRADENNTAHPTPRAPII